jgi:hypothetical protein
VAAAVPRQRRRRAWWRPLVWLLALIIVGGVGVAHVILAKQLRVPIIYGDELGYIENARYLVYGGARPARTYYPGLSLLLVPAWMMTRDALSVWRSAQIINAAAAVVTAIEAVLLGGVLGLRAVWRWLVAIAASAYPPVLLYSDVALSESLFAAVFVGLVLLVALAGSRSSRPRAGGPVGAGMAAWGLAGLTAAALSLTHPRGFAVDVAVVLIAVVLLRPVRVHINRWLSLAAGMTLGLALMRLALVATRATNVGGRTDYEASGVVGRNLNMHAFGNLTAAVIGRLFYLSVATVGLVPFALLVGAAALVAVIGGDRRPAQIARAFATLSAVGVAGLSVLLVNTGTRADELIHGRYVDGVVVPLLVIGLGDLIVSRGRLWWAWALSGVGAVAGTGGFLDATGSLGNLKQPINSINILGIEPFIRRFSADQVKVLPLVVAGVAAVAVLSLVAVRLPQLVAVVLIVGFVWSALDTQSHYLVSGSKSEARETVLVDAVQAASAQLGVPRSCVSYDGQLDFNYFADRLLLGTQPLDFLGPGDRPCGPFVISSLPRFEQRFPGSRLVLDEDDVPEGLYVLPGATQESLGAAGWLQPDPAPGPVPVRGQLADIDVLTAGPLGVVSGTTDALPVRITNSGRVSPWAAAAGTKQAAYAVRVAERWFAPGVTPSNNGGATKPVAMTVIDFPRSLLPGESTSFNLPLVAQARSGAPLPPAQYRVRIAVYQELVGTFAGAITLTVNVVNPPTRQ